YINSSKLFLTDSFHGSVFSIILKRPFFVFDRKGSKKSMGSRIDTLLSTFNLQDRKWELNNKANNIFEVDFSHTDAILQIERENSLRFLKQSLGISKNI